MCFAPQRRALFRHRNFQKWSGAEVFCTFWLGNVLRATTACTFSTSQLPKVVRTPGVFNILTWKCASRHNGVQFCIAPVASWLRTRRFSEPTFRPSGATNHWKNTVFRDFPTFSRICSVCPLTLSLLIFSLLIFLFSVPLPCSAFHLSILSEVWLLNFLRIWPLLIISYNKKGLSIWGRVRFNKREKRLKSQSCDLRMHSSYKHVANPRAVNPKQNKWYTMQIHAVYSQWSGIDRSWQFTLLANYPAKK